jgi:dihydrodipicolinate synthase/N-acetylneuraminate lyase
MYAPDELHGLNAMMPAFAKPGSEDYWAEDTVDVDNLREAVDKLIRDGANVISTTGSYGEFHTLLDSEFRTLVKATLEAVNKRVPVFVGVTSMNGREVARKAKFVQEVGGEGIFTGVPFYYPPTVQNLIRFYHDIADMFPNLSIQIYHNPPLHNIHIPVSAYPKLTEKRNIVSQKDSHRTPLEFMRLMDIVRGKISLFVNQSQYYPFATLGARGFWSTEVWMGPWPLLKLRDAVDSGDYETAKQVLLDITGGGGSRFDGHEPQDNARKIAASTTGYCNQGPNRSPFLEITKESMDAAMKRAEHWKSLNAKYRPQVEALVGAR